MTDSKCINAQGGALMLGSGFQWGQDSLFGGASQQTFSGALPLGGCQPCSKFDTAGDVTIELLVK